MQRNSIIRHAMREAWHRNVTQRIARLMQERREFLDALARQSPKSIRCSDGYLRIMVPCDCGRADRHWGWVEVAEGDIWYRQHCPHGCLIPGSHPRIDGPKFRRLLEEAA